MSTPIREEVETAIRSFIQDYFLVDFGTDFDAATDLFDTQIIDSFGFVELVRFLESEFNVAIRDSDLVSGELTSINSMASLIEKRTHEPIHA